MNNQTHQNAQRNLNWQGWQILFPAALVQKFFSITSTTVREDGITWPAP